MDETHAHASGSATSGEDSPTTGEAGTIEPSLPPTGRIDFYGKRITFLKLFGQSRWGDCSPGQVDGTKIYHSPGVQVDRSIKPNAIYVADSGNNRILGFRSHTSKRADLVFGQRDDSSSAPNRDCNIGRFGPPTRASLSLLDVPGGSNTAEQWRRINFDVDGDGNLYVPDYDNNRVLVYRSPFSPDKSNGKGDSIPDLVIGQADYTSNGINRGRGPGQADAQSLFLSVGDAVGFDGVSSRGVSVDKQGNIWAADTFNCRVLRFPKGKTTADLVLGQPKFTTSQPPATPIDATPLDRMFTPTLARMNPRTGELFVVDEHPAGFKARILVFTPPFRNGMAASRVIVPQQVLKGDYAGGYMFTHCTGLFFPEDAPATAQDDLLRRGEVWAYDATRLLLLGPAGQILVAIGATDLVSHGFSDQMYAQSEMDYVQPYNVSWAGGSVGFDDESNIYLADDAFHRVARYPLPWTPRTIVHNGQPTPALPFTNGGFFPETIPNNVGPAHMNGPGLGAFTFRNQLIVREHKRYMVWNNYLRKRDGAPADVFVGQRDGSSLDQENDLYGGSMHAIDQMNRVWATGVHGKLMAYRLPMVPGAQPVLRQARLFWDDERDREVDYQCGLAVAFEKATTSLWLFDYPRHRALRVSVPDNLNQPLRVTAVIGQVNKEDGQVNRGMARPDASSLGVVNCITFDRLGNGILVDNTFELHENGRIIGFAAKDLQAIDEMFPPIKARWVWVATGFDQPVWQRIFLPGEQPKSPVCVAFNARNEMVVGNDGYYEGNPGRRNVNQLFLYRDPYNKFMPDAVIQLPMGTPGEINFDDQDNLLVGDHTYLKTWLINIRRDREWLRPTKT